MSTIFENIRYQRENIGCLSNLANGDLYSALLWLYENLDHDRDGWSIHESMEPGEINEVLESYVQGTWPSAAEFARAALAMPRFPDWLRIDWEASWEALKASGSHNAIPLKSGQVLIIEYG